MAGRAYNAIDETVRSCAAVRQASCPCRTWRDRFRCWSAR